MAAALCSCPNNMAKRPKNLGRLATNNRGDKYVFREFTSETFSGVFVDYCMCFGITGMIVEIP